MSPKKKPKIKYHISDNGNVIDASIDDHTHFISFKRPIESKTEGEISISKLGGKRGKQKKDEWIAAVWEEGEVMPPSVWDEKRRHELLTKISGSIAVATGSAPGDIAVSTTSGTVIPWTTPPAALSQCRECGSILPPNCRFCPECGEPQ